jgi:molybdopterin converting factor small subunit
VALTFFIPEYLRRWTGGEASVTLDCAAATVADALAALFAAHPGVADRVMTEDGRVRQHVNVFVGDESIKWTGGLGTPVRSGAEISIIPAVSGGIAAVSGG